MVIRLCSEALSNTDVFPLKMVLAFLPPRSGIDRVGHVGMVLDDGVGGGVGLME